MAAYKKSKYTVEVPFVKDGETVIGIYHTMTGAFYLICEKDWANAIHNPHALTDPALIDTLCEPGILMGEDVDETGLFETWKNQYVHDFSTLKSKVLVTRKCNNQCTYCIIDPEAKEMSSETAKAMDRFYINMIMERKPSHVQDDFLGGEPLLNAGIIMESAQRRFFFCQGKEIDYGFTITTNGTLMAKSAVSDMKEIGLTGIRVSLAGPASIHDRLRPSKTYEKPYERIIKNLEMVSGLIPISIECQYDSGALDFVSIPEMLDDLTRRNIHIDAIAFTPILSRRGEKPFDSGMGDPRIFLYLKHEALKRGFPMNDHAPSNACMTDLRSIVVFDTDGSLIPCPSLQSNEMVYGNIITGINFVAESRLLKRNLSDRCLNECELLPICFGGCRLQSLIHSNDFNGIDCHYDAYRLFLEDYIKEKARTFLSQQE